MPGQAAMLAMPVFAQFGSGSGFGPGGAGDGSYPGSSSGTGDAGFSGYDGWLRRRTVHGVLAAVAFVVVFPLGAVALRLLPGRLGFWVHAVAQTAGWVLFVVAAALGFVLLREVGNGGSLLVSFFFLLRGLIYDVPGHVCSPDIVA